MLKMTGRPKFAIKSQCELNSSKTNVINIHFKPISYLAADYLFLIYPKEILGETSELILQ